MLYTIDRVIYSTASSKQLDGKRVNLKMPTLGSFKDGLSLLHNLSLSSDPQWFALLTTLHHTPILVRLWPSGEVSLNFNLNPNFQDIRLIRANSLVPLVSTGWRPVLLWCELL